MPLAIQIRSVVKRYGKITAVDGLDLDFPEGDVRRAARTERALLDAAGRLLVTSALAESSPDPRFGQAIAPGAKE